MGTSKVELYILAAPEFTPDDTRLLKSLRAEHCPPDQIDLPPHIMLAFSLPHRIADAVISQIQDCALSFPPFDLTLDEIVRERGCRTDSSHYIFLKPGRGRRELFELHRNLADRIPEVGQTLQKPLDPHVTIGVFRTENDCRDLMQRLS